MNCKGAYSYWHHDLKPGLNSQHIKILKENLNKLETSTFFNLKFYNTYGPSLMYNINNEENIDRINLSLKFEIKFVSNSETVLLDDIIQQMKDKVEECKSFL